MSEFRSGTDSSFASEIKQQLSPFSNYGGFNFDNTMRNRLLLNSSKPAVQLNTRKTGTTIVGLIFKDGVVLGADTRATSGTEVCDKNCEKIHFIAPNIYCCGAGTAADTEKTTELIASQLELLRLNTGAQSRVVAAMMLIHKLLFRYQGHIGAALILGGVDCTGPQLYSCHPHGSSHQEPYVTMGSGSLAAMSVFETGYKDNMEEAEAVELVKEAILSGIFNDLGSGSNCDITVIRKGGEITRMRGFETPNDVALLKATVGRPKAFDVEANTTTVLDYRFTPISSKVAVEAVEAMVL